MILLYVENQFVEVTQTNQDLILEAVWIDLLNPTRKDEKLIEEYLNINVPTKKEMKEIEPSSRFYVEDDSVFMTATMVAKADSPEPETDAVTFILTENKLVTVRYIEPMAFRIFMTRMGNAKRKEFTPKRVLIGLLDATTDRLADILENVSHIFDTISHTIFHSGHADEAGVINYKEVLKSIGKNGDLTTKTRESLLSFIRLISFLEQSEDVELDSAARSRLNSINKDILALSDYASFISTKVNFLVESTLGMVNIEQNNIIKIFSVAAVIFLPPTLVASIYGMNFDLMPELHWRIGYPIAVGLMLLSAWLPYRYFKQRKWL